MENTELNIDSLIKMLLSKDLEDVKLGVEIVNSSFSGKELDIFREKFWNKLQVTDRFQPGGVIYYWSKSNIRPGQMYYYHIDFKDLLYL